MEFIIIGIITGIIIIIGLIPGIFFNKKAKSIEQTIQTEESKETNYNQNLYKIQIELTNLRKIFSTFLTLILIPIFVKLIILIIGISKILEISQKFS